MVLLLTGLNKIRDLHKANIDKAWMGTSGVAVTEAQTGLQAGNTTTKLAVTITSADRVNVVSYTLPSTTATGQTYREFAVIKDGVVEYNRVTFTGITHGTSDDIIVRQTFVYRNP